MASIVDVEAIGPAYAEKLKDKGQTTSPSVPTAWMKVESEPRATMAVIGRTYAR